MQHYSMYKVRGRVPMKWMGCGSKTRLEEGKSGTVTTRKITSVCGEVRCWKDELASTSCWCTCDIATDLTLGRHFELKLHELLLSTERKGLMKSIYN